MHEEAGCPNHAEKQPQIDVRKSRTHSLQGLLPFRFVMEGEAQITGVTQTVEAAESAVGFGDGGDEGARVAHIDPRERQ